MFKRFSILNKFEKIAVTFLLLVAVVSLFQIGMAFYDSHTEIRPVKGGIYVAGSVGKIGVINPLFMQLGSITHDLTQLIFSGLTRYDPKTGSIVPDLAEFEVSDDGKTYTFKINERAVWHDGVSVTSNDVLFTYNNVINNPAFKGPILNYNDYTGIKVAKVDNRTVQFLLEAPDSFFLVKTITGLLPEHLLGHLPVDTLESAPFNMMPVGSGPYRFASISPIDNYNEVTLDSFPDYYGQEPNISTIQLRVFSDFKELLKRQGDLDGIRNLPDEYTDDVLKKGRLHIDRYQLPQYVAVFINTQADKVKNNKIRLALQLGTDKQAIVDAIGQSKIIDTPLLEIDQRNWVYQHSVSKANGALFETEWQLPDKLTESNSETTDESTKESAETKPEPKYITGPNLGNDWQTTDTKVTITGITPEKTKSIFVNDYELKKFVPGDPGWSYVASFEFGNLKKGENVFTISATDFNGKKLEIGSITIHQGTEDEFMDKELEVLSEENQAADDLPLRVNKNDETLVLHLVTPEKPEVYGQIAQLLKEQWKKIGIGVTIDVLENEAFQDALFRRDYDLLIFGQNLGYNLDAYPYWHSSQAKEGGYNLSQFKNFIVDSLLEKARMQNDEEERKKTLNNIQEIISKEVPAIFLYSPTYNFALSNKIQNTTFDNLATVSDRFARISDWYAKVSHQLSDGVTPLTFFSWIIKQF